MAHKKGVGSSRNGRDSNPQMLGVKRFGGPVRHRGQHHRPPARHPLQAGRQRRPRRGPHALRQEPTATCRFERKGDDKYVSIAQQRCLIRPAMTGRRPPCSSTKIDVFVKGGDGGAGCMSFRREKFVPAAARTAATAATAAAWSSRPTPSITTLLDFHYQRPLHRRAGPARQGRQPVTGASGATPCSRVPLGTMVYERRLGRARWAISPRPGERSLVARGARGGRGNARFATSTNRAPRRAPTSGAPARSAGSTSSSSSWPTWGDRLSQRGQVHAGLAALRGQAQDRGLSLHHARALARHRAGGRGSSRSSSPTCRGSSKARPRARASGHRFLRHTERTRLLVHLVDLDPSGEPRSGGGLAGRSRASSPRIPEELAARPQIVAGSKAELPGTEARAQAAGALLRGARQLALPRHLRGDRDGPHRAGAPRSARGS